MKTKGILIAMRIDSEGKRLGPYEQRECLHYIYNETIQEFVVEGKKSRELAKRAYRKLWKQERGM
jgi:hypothetical protein